MSVCVHTRNDWAAVDAGELKAFTLKYTQLTIKELDLEYKLKMLKMERESIQALMGSIYYQKKAISSKIDRYHMLNDLSQGIYRGSRHYNHHEISRRIEDDSEDKDDF